MYGLPICHDNPRQRPIAPRILATLWSLPGTQSGAKCIAWGRRARTYASALTSEGQVAAELGGDIDLVVIRGGRSPRRWRRNAAGGATAPCRERLDGGRGSLLPCEARRSADSGRRTHGPGARRITGGPPAIGAGAKRNTVALEI